MENIWALSIVFLSIIVICAISAWESVKKKKIEAALRMEEMRNGYAPGTYSDYKKGEKKSKGKVKHLHEEMEEAAKRGEEKNLEREQLKKDIAGLETRLDNLQTIMDGRHEHEETNKGKKE
jgi:hypothetical protein